MSLWSETDRWNEHTEWIWLERWYVSIFNLISGLTLRSPVCHLKMRVIHIFFFWLLIFFRCLTLSALCALWLFTFSKQKIISKWKPYYFFFSFQKVLFFRFGSTRPWNVRKMSDLCYFIRNEMKSRRNFYPIYYSQIIQCTFWIFIRQTVNCVHWRKMLLVAIWEYGIQCGARYNFVMNYDGIN